MKCVFVYILLVVCTTGCVSKKGSKFGSLIKSLQSFSIENEDHTEETEILQQDPAEKFSLRQLFPKESLKSNPDYHDKDAKTEVSDTSDTLKKSGFATRTLEVGRIMQILMKNNVFSELPMILVKKEWPEIIALFKKIVTKYLELLFPRSALQFEYFTKHCDTIVQVIVDIEKALRWGIKEVAKKSPALSLKIQFLRPITRLLKLGMSLLRRFSYLVLSWFDDGEMKQILTRLVQVVKDLAQAELH